MWRTRMHFPLRARAGSMRSMQRRAASPPPAHAVLGKKEKKGTEELSVRVPLDSKKGDEGIIRSSPGELSGGPPANNSSAPFKGVD